MCELTVVSRLKPVHRDSQIGMAPAWLVWRRGVTSRVIDRLAMHLRLNPVERGPTVACHLTSHCTTAVAVPAAEVASANSVGDERLPSSTRATFPVAAAAALPATPPLSWTGAGDEESTLASVPEAVLVLVLVLFSFRMRWCFRRSAISFS